MSNLRKKCDCPKISYITTHKKYEEKQDQYIKEISYDIDECKNHPQSHMNRRNEVHRIYMNSPLELPKTLNQEEKEIFQSSFKNCQEKKISKATWDKAIESQLSEKSSEQIFIDQCLHSGIIELIDEYYSTKSGKKEYVFLTPRGYQFLKQYLDIVEDDEQIAFSQRLIEDTLKITYENPNPQLSRLLTLIKTQLERIKNSDPYWEKDTGEKIKPQSVQKNLPGYYIITKTLCTWIRMYRDRITKRELSCVSFSDDRVIKDQDPSKVLDLSYDSLEAIIQPRSLGFLDLDDFGLIKTLETIQMSGSIEIDTNDQSKRFESPLIVLNNYEFQNIQSLTSESLKILFIENLAVFTQLVYDKFALEQNIMIVFIHGKSSRYLQKILKNFAKDKKKHEYWAWLDNDLGGIEIFQFIEKLFPNRTINPIIPMQNNPIPYRPITEKEISKIKKMIISSSSSVWKFGNQILKTGKIEQEYFIKEYRKILKINFEEKIENISE